MHRRLVLSLVGMALLLGATGCDGGERLIVVHVECDGVHVLQSQFGATDDVPVPILWATLAELKFKSIRRVDRLPNDRNSGLVTGKVRILLLHADAIIASADLDRLRVTQVPGTDVYWTIPNDEVERTAKSVQYSK